MHQPPSADQSTFDSQARYNLQATEDVDAEQHFVEEEKKRTIQLPKRPNYKPKPLRWPFITVVILLLGILMALTIVETTSTASERQTASSINSKDSTVSTGPPSSSTTAKTGTGTPSSSDSESKSASSTESERSADETSSSTGRQGKEGPAITETNSGSDITLFTSSTSRGRFKLPVITSEFTTTITKPGSTTTYTNEITIHVPSTFTSTGKTTIPGTQGVTTYTDVRTTSVPRTITRSGVTSFAHATIIPVKPTMTSVENISGERFTEHTVSEVVETSFEPIEITYTSISSFTVPPRTSDITSIIVSAVPSTVASVVTSTSPPQVYVSVGTTEITKFITVPGGNRGNEPQTQPPVFQVITSVFDGKVETFVDKGTPQTMVKSDGGVYTVAFTPPPQTIVTHEGGQATQMVITVTPSPEVAFVAVPTTKDGAGAFKEMPTTIDGKATVVNVPITQEPVLLAVQTIIDGTPTVLWINSVPTAGFSPISLTLVSEIGGFTGVFTTIDPLETTKTTIDAIEGCGIQLGVSPVSSYALVALIAFIVFLLLVLLFFLRTWETGLHANPWSIAGISSLARNADIRSHQIDFKASAKAMREKRYGFGYFENNLGRDEYGIIYCDDSAQSLQGATASGAIPADDELTGTYQRDIAKKTRKPVPFIALTWWWRLGFIFFLTALFIIILYYHLTLGVRTSFKDFMDSQTFGVRFFFAALGVTIIFCWESIFISIAIISPYHNMGRRSQPPEKSILLTRPTNGFYGLYAAILEGNIILMLAAFMSILAEFLPILFANVPYNLTQTLKSHNVCATISLTILALMLASMVASLFIKWPELPVDPRSIAGALYYVAESRMLEDFEGLSKLDSEEREKKVKELGRRYFYGGLTGSNGKRMGVESVESVEDTAYTGGHWFLPPQEDQ
ncbi:hypothetical protein N0V92_000659 [Colletotrichum tropicale]|nr:hypothetical protein N0V92_000659 [Colletotrichum tropicale]